VDAPLRGRTIDRVYASGKNLIIDFSGGLHLRTHMRMHGSWHLYRPGERWKRASADMRIVIETAPWIAVGFSVPVAELLDDEALARNADLNEIGPDLLGESFDEAEAFRRIRGRADEEIADVLLNQRVAAGIGNEFKNEILFLAGINPFTLVRNLSDEQITSTLGIARKIMRANIAKRSSRRMTTWSLDPNKAQYVMSRGGQPCRKCATPIEYRKQGPNARGTYWCPTCQPVS